MQLSPWEWTLCHPVPTETQRAGGESLIGRFCVERAVFCVVAEGMEMKRNLLRFWCYLRTGAVAREGQQQQ